ncbi:COX assembly mitochondrial protein homolog isoform X2 [Patiria miniata]|uniref:COX assembly mitochondrial protein n=1 Tax=Patiria miniata TaxID=46514 RepID=A0A913ZKM7_PATMI|nr:COX assembly mitochondrial protein homolog isoform X2 [Patiria miniata]
MTIHHKLQKTVWQNDETYLRNVEREVLIPKKMRDKAKVQCAQYVDAFTKCCQDSGLAMAIKCRKENSELKECVTKYYKDPEFFEMCKQEYLAERAEFRATGITKKKKKLLEQQQQAEQDQQQPT